ncbi:50S ribosomal protein L35 [candidate division KSB3 bacterium]|jgi:large subunit ribosomal protein L35|uniref:Large ribosomal subunit protein bL35 n=1 Tax=candidate division KSB3 bacterium TaxID=2044937 RepID=A0A9D5JY88_9BACT|nr:50S ribosomal protein L35 [candidate division KSB3 bacterium]MBD3326374.1 50S ribosomal protein L35 [candidate division KSB3 bacterium]
MPKMKTNKGAAKRFRKTASGKIQRKKANAGHIFTKKTRKRKRHLRQATTVAAVDKKRVNRLIPYA